jgi:hypothetical protein
MPSPKRPMSSANSGPEEQQGELFLRPAGEEPGQNEEEEQIGTATVLTREAAGGTVTIMYWANEDLYSEAISEGPDAETF